MKAEAYPCPCCGYRVFARPPGSEDPCPICGWIDDLMQLRFAAFDGQPNRISLLRAQRNYAAIGAKDEAALTHVRFPRDGDVRDPEWRALDTDSDDVGSVPVDFDALAEPEDPSALYYWLPRHRG